MLNLNLLPPEEKHNLAYAMRARAVAVLGAGLAAVFAVFAAFLLPTAFFLASEKSEAAGVLDMRRRSLGQSDMSARTAEIGRINQLAEYVLRHEKERPEVFALFEAVMREAPKALRLETIRFRPEKGELVMEGFAPARSDLLEFIRALERSPRAGKVSSPVANLVKETDIKFSLTVKLK